MATRYKLSKEQLERVVENFVMEAASAKAPVKNHIPSQGSEAKKHVKNKISGKIVDKSEGMPSVTPMKKKLSQAPESKKFVSNSKMTHSNKAKVVKENEVIEEGMSPEELKAKAESMWNAQQKDILQTIVNKWKSKKEEAFGDWAKKYFEGGDVKKALTSILEDQKNKFIEAYVQGGGSALGGFKYSTGEYVEGNKGGFMNSPTAW
jgi:UDP-N-acetylmuramyl tripeptide synthase